MKKVILASESPRRKELLEKSGIPFTIVPSAYEEDMSLDLPPEELTKLLSLGKAQDISKAYSDAVIIAADTFIVHEDDFVGKPFTEQKAIQTLQKLEGSKILIVSGITVVDTRSGSSTSSSITTSAYMKKLSKKEILDYVATGEPLDCAGAFNVRGHGKDIIEEIDGSYTNIMGLPMEELQEMLLPFEIHFLHDTESWLKNELS